MRPTLRGDGGDFGLGARDGLWERKQHGQVAVDRFFLQLFGGIGRNRRLWIHAPVMKLDPHFFPKSRPVYVSPPESYDPLVRAEEFHRCVGVLPYGKTLPGARYIFRPNGNNLSWAFLTVVKRAEIAASPPPDWNLLKLHTNEFAVTFLSYPEFDTDPHPALAEATKINLKSHSVRLAARLSWSRIRRGAASSMTIIELLPDRG